MEECGLPSKPTPKWTSGWGVRHTQSLLLFICVAAIYMLRLNLSLAVVAMATSPNYKIIWDSGEKALVLSSLFWGYSLLQTYLGNLGRKGNPVKVFACCLVTSAGLSMATPFAAIHFGVYGIIPIRVAMGLAQGGIYGNLNNLLAMWAVPQEKDIICVLVYNGAAFGTFVSYISSGYLAAQFDWPSIFYVTGITGVLIGGAYLYLGQSSPAVHEGISKEEKEFMRNSFGDKCGESTKLLSVPWKKILTSRPLLALTFTHWCCSWGIWTITTLTPLYLNSVLGFGVERDGFLSALSSGLGLCLGIIFMVISIFINKRNLLPVSFTRFMWNSLAMYGSAACLIVLSYVQNTELAVVLITISNSVTVAVNIGYMSNHTDLSPNFAGVLYAFTNSVANLAAIFGPLISTYLIKDTENLIEWRIVFLSSAAILSLGNTVFLILGTTKKQAWND